MLVYKQNKITENPKKLHFVVKVYSVHLLTYNI